MYSEFLLFKTYVEKQFFEVLSVLSDLKSVVCVNDHHDHMTEDVAGDVSSSEATESMLSKKSDDGDHDAVETPKDVFESGTPKEDLCLPLQLLVSHKFKLFGDEGSF
ncbi:uncharacterized protein LOC126674956 [Mercurialis annua]|uniref:uncharacterized protein LOC126674956 n=1 Tax=Mercurialis annua TaxID=3986 RepID=UPI00215DE60D|nr:uncharacterized protein LOC126674956 [Mercurialis annua]